MRPPRFLRHNCASTLMELSGVLQEHMFLRSKNRAQFTINPATPFFTTKFSRYVSRTRVFTLKESAALHNKSAHPIFYYKIRQRIFTTFQEHVFLRLKKSARTVEQGPGTKGAELPPDKENPRPRPLPGKPFCFTKLLFSIVFRIELELIS